MDGVQITTPSGISQPLSVTSGTGTQGPLQLSAGPTTAESTQVAAKSIQTVAGSALQSQPQGVFDAVKDVPRMYTNAAERAQSISIQAGSKCPLIPPAPQPSSTSPSMLANVIGWAQQSTPLRDTRSSFEKRGWAPPPVQKPTPSPVQSQSGDASNQPLRYSRKDRQGGPITPTIVGGFPAPVIGNLGWPASEQPRAAASQGILGGLASGVSLSPGGVLGGQASGASLSQGVALGGLPSGASLSQGGVLGGRALKAVLPQGSALGGVASATALPQQGGLEGISLFKSLPQQGVPSATTSLPQLGVLGGLPAETSLPQRGGSGGLAGMSLPHQGVFGGLASAGSSAASLPHQGVLGGLASAGGGLFNQQPQLSITPPQQHQSLPNVLFAEWYIQRLGWLANALMNRPRPKDEVRDIPCGIFLTALENDGISRVQSDLNLKSFSHVVGAVGSGTLLDDILRSHTAIVVDMLQRQEAERKDALELLARANCRISSLEMELKTTKYKLASEVEVTKRLMSALKKVQGAGLTEKQLDALEGLFSVPSVPNPAQDLLNRVENPSLKRAREGSFQGASGVVEVVVLDPEEGVSKRGPGRPRKEERNVPGGGGTQSDLQSTNAQPSNLQSANAQPSNLQATNVQPRNVHCTSTQTANVQRSSGQPATPQPTKPPLASVQPLNPHPSGPSPGVRPPNPQSADVRPTDAQAQVVETASTGKRRLSIEALENSGWAKKRRGEEAQNETVRLERSIAPRPLDRTSLASTNAQPANVRSASIPPLSVPLGNQPTSTPPQHPISHPTLPGSGPFPGAAFAGGFPLFKPVAPSITSAALASIATVPLFAGMHSGPPAARPFELPERTSVTLSNGKGPKMASYFEIPEKTSIEDATKSAQTDKPPGERLTATAKEALREGFVLPERVSITTQDGRTASGELKQGKSGVLYVVMKGAEKAGGDGAGQADVLIGKVDVAAANDLPTAGGTAEGVSKDADSRPAEGEPGKALREYSAQRAAEKTEDSNAVDPADVLIGKVDRAAANVALTAGGVLESYPEAVDSGPAEEEPKGGPTQKLIQLSVEQTEVDEADVLIGEVDVAAANEAPTAGGAPESAANRRPAEGNNEDAPAEKLVQEAETNPGLVEANLEALKSSRSDREKRDEAMAEKGPPQDSIGSESKDVGKGAKASQESKDGAPESEAGKGILGERDEKTTELSLVGGVALEDSAGKAAEATKNEEDAAVGSPHSEDLFLDAVAELPGGEEEPVGERRRDGDENANSAAERETRVATTKESTGQRRSPVDELSRGGEMTKSPGEKAGEKSSCMQEEREAGRSRETAGEKSPYLKVLEVAGDTGETAWEKGSEEGEKRKGEKSPTPKEDQQPREKAESTGGKEGERSLVGSEERRGEGAESTGGEAGRKSPLEEKGRTREEARSSGDKGEEENSAGRRKEVEEKAQSMSGTGVEKSPVEGELEVEEEGRSMGKDKGRTTAIEGEERAESTQERATEKTPVKSPGRTRGRAQEAAQTPLRRSERHK